MEAGGEQKPLSALEQLQTNHKFTIIRDDKHDFISRFLFEDGRQYKFQEPPFFELHEAIYSGAPFSTALLQVGIANTFPENENTPPLTEEYLSKNKVEAIQLWTKLYGEVLFQGDRP